MKDISNTNSVLDSNFEDDGEERVDLGVITYIAGIIYKELRFLFANCVLFYYYTLVTVVL